MPMFRSRQRPRPEKKAAASSVLAPGELRRWIFSSMPMTSSMTAVSFGASPQPMSAFSCVSVSMSCRVVAPVLTLVTLTFLSMAVGGLKGDYFKVGR